jgi:hypothetical protein
MQWWSKDKGREDNISRQNTSQTSKCFNLVTVNILLHVKRGNEKV